VPSPFLSHQAVVLPLKLWRPRWFDGTALVVGSMAPDLSYFLTPGFRIPAHSFVAVLYFNVPLTLALLPIVRYLLAPDLARWGPSAFRAFALLDHPEPSWWVRTTSAAIGACSHIFWDGLTLPEQSFVGRFSVFRDPSFEFDPQKRAWFRLLHDGSSALGAAVAAFFFVRLASKLGAAAAAEHVAVATDDDDARRRSYRRGLVIGVFAAALTATASIEDAGFSASVMRATWVLGAWLVTWGIVLRVRSFSDTLV
jgi:hypothetical protein